MTTDDIYQISSLESKIFKTTLGVNFLHDELTINPFAHYFILEENNKIIGYIGYRAYDENVEILNFLIDTDYQYQGYGSKLLTETINELKINAIKSISLEVRESNAKAINFYLKHDFKFSHKRPNYYETEDALVYIKEV